MNRTNSRSRPCRAFTLIELLAVITIIGLLAALLFPVFLRARESARRSVCESNLHQTGLAIQMYQADSGGALPGRFRDVRNEPLELRAGFDLLLPYTHDESIYDCPDAAPPPPGFSRMDYRYRVNDLLHLNGEGAGVPDTLLKPDPESVLLYDMNHYEHGSGMYLALRANGAVSSVAASRVAFWVYRHGQWYEHYTMGVGDADVLWEVFPDEPWPPQFEK